MVAPIVIAAALAFEKGGVIPGATSSAVPIFGHAGEMVLPAHLSKFVQTAAAGAGGAARASSIPGLPGGTDRPIHLHMHNTVSTLDSDGVEDVPAAHGPKMFSYFKGQLRKQGVNL